MLKFVAVVKSIICLYIIVQHAKDYLNDKN